MRNYVTVILLSYTKVQAFISPSHASRVRLHIRHLVPKLPTPPSKHDIFSVQLRTQNLSKYQYHEACLIRIHIAFTAVWIVVSTLCDCEFDNALYS